MCLAVVDMSGEFIGSREKLEEGFFWHPLIELPVPHKSFCILYHYSSAQG